MLLLLAGFIQWKTMASASLLRSFHLSVLPQPLQMLLLLHLKVQTKSQIL